jgi:hypothetical protein
MTLFAAIWPDDAIAPFGVVIVGTFGLTIV